MHVEVLTGYISSADALGAERWLRTMGERGFPPAAAAYNMAPSSISGGGEPRRCITWCAILLVVRIAHGPSSVYR